MGLLPGRVRLWEEMGGDGHQSSMQQGMSGESGPYDPFMTEPYLKWGVCTSSLRFVESVACTAEVDNQNIGSPGGQRSEAGGGTVTHIGPQDEMQGRNSSRGLL